MKDKKHIDRIFQEKFKDFEAKPNKKVWGNLKKELQEKKKKRPIAIPLWYKIGGAAAVLIGALLLSNALFFNPTKENNVVTSPQKSKESIKVESKEKTFTTSEQEEFNHDNGVATESFSIKNKAQKAIEEKKQNKFSTPKNSSVATATSEKNNAQKNKSLNSTAVKNNVSDKNNSEESIGIASAKSSKKSGDNFKNEATIAAASQENTSKNSSEKNSFNKIEKTTNSVENNSLTNDENNTSLAEVETEEIITKEEKPSLIEEAKKLEEEATKEEQKTSEEKLTKWAVKPNVSPIYYGSLSGGNTIDSQFNNNSSSGEVTMAYGVNFAYALSEKINIRSGVSRVNMSYNTNDIVFTSSVSAMNLQGLRKNSSSENIQVLSQAEVGSSELQGRGVPYTSGTLNQQLGFVEIPLEIEYALLNERFNINVIGGASTLVLSDNSIAINSAGGTTDLGKANNLNDLSFSTNLGLGLGYELNKSFDLSLEPTFKYQLNTFSGNTNGFKPYYFGVYTGLSFKF
ncbi:hypothetical protein [Mesonia aquimarina]|uniref:hypothetical protein n=1 Tax=Mesonia aquimarina TaxID=1504967 RepID=UPI000EF62A33|nr:hypothetical protein [Mesonia aquimarina]